MNYTLTIDQGNTRTKATVIAECGDIVRRDSYEQFDIETLIDNYADYELSGIIYSSVTRMDVRLIESIRHTYPDLLEVLTHQCDTGVTVDYDTPQTLGADRVAAVAGAISLYPSEAMLIVDAGTAITIDIADSTGCFRGGNISAGIALRINALHNATASLPQVSIEGATPDFGRDTQSAIRSGAIRGVAWEIEGAYNVANKTYGCSRVILTGGDASLIAKHLLLPDGVVSVEPDLVARGLDCILRKIRAAETLKE